MARAVQENQPTLRQVETAAGTGLLVMALITAACGAPKPTEGPTPQPTTKPTELVTPMPTPSQTEVLPTPTGTIVVTFPPSPSASPIRTPEITASPEATPIPISNLVDQIVADADQNGWPNTFKQNVTDSINEAYNNDPQAATLLDPDGNLVQNYVDGEWDTCATTTSTDRKILSCAGTFGLIYWKGFRIDNNIIWIPDFATEKRNSPLSNLIYYAHDNLSPQDFDSFIAYAGIQQSPF